MKYYWILWVTLASMGCADMGERAPDLGACGANCEGWDVSEEVPPIDEPDGSDEPGEALRPCAPTAMVSGQFALPLLPDEIRAGACPLERELTTLFGPFATPERELTWEYNDGTWQREERVGGALKVRTRFELADDGEQLARVEQRHAGYSDITGHSSISEDIWELDAQGHVVRHVNRSLDGALGEEALTSEHEITQTFRDGRLVRRHEQSNTTSSPNAVDISWRYDDAGRLLEALQMAGAREDRAVWEYDGDLPVGVSRYISGRLVERMSWAFEDGRLVSRQAMVGVDLDGEVGGATGQLPKPVVLDSYMLRSTHHHWDSSAIRTLTPWSGANAHLNAGEDARCYPLPTSLGHGYPEDEKNYFIGQSPEELPEDGMEYAYGYQRNFMGLERPIWYGHMGVGSIWLAPSFELQQQIQSTVHYDDTGRMVAEWMEQSFQDPQVDAMIVARTRDFEGSNLLYDAIEVTSGVDVIRSALHFERNAAGVLLRRERTRNDMPMEFQTWRYDANNAVLATELYSALDASATPDAPHRYFAMELGALFQTPPAQPPAYILGVEREVDASGREVFYRDDRLLEAHELARQTTWGEHGMLEQSVRTTQSAIDFERYWRTTWEYDASGRLLRTSFDENGDADFERETIYTRDEAGREVERVERSNGAVMSRVTREYRCH